MAALRTRRGAAAALAVAALLALTATGLARLRLDTTVASFLPGGDATVTTTAAEQASFGADPIVVLLRSQQPGQLLSGTPLRQEIALEARIARLPDVAVVYGPGTTLNEIALSLQQVLVDISAQRDALMQQAAATAKAAGASGAAQSAAAQAAVAGYDQRYGALLERGLQVGLPTTGNAGLGQRVFLQPDGRGQPAFRWLVPDATHAAILIRPVPGLPQSRTSHLVDEVRADIRRAGLPIGPAAVSGYPVIIAALGQEVTTELPLLAACSLVVVAAGFVLARRRRPLWERLVHLAAGLAAAAVTLAGFGWAGRPLSLGVLAFLPVILGVGTDYPIYALRRSRPRVVLVTAAASAASLAVLALDPLPYVRDLGVALGAGLVASALSGIAAARALGARAGEPADLHGAHDPGRRRDRPVPGEPARPRPPRLGRLGAAAAAVVVAGAGWASLGGLRLDSDPQRLASGLPAVAQGQAVQSVLGASGELDVYVRGADVLTPAYLAWYQRAQTALLEAHGDRLRPIVSPASLLSWLGSDPTPGQIRAATSLLPAYLTDAAVRGDRTEAVLSYGVQLGSFGSDAALVADIERALPPPPAGTAVSVTGLPAVAARSWSLLSGSRLVPNLAGIAAFGGLLLLLLPDRRTAVRAVLAAALAAGWGFALLRVTGTPLTPLTVSLGSLTSAVGGEFTVMALARAADGVARPWSAVVAAAATSVAGFLVLTLSRLEVLRQFGLVLAGSVALALLAASLVVSLGGDRRRPEVAQQRRRPPDPAEPARQEVVGV